MNTHTMHKYIATAFILLFLTGCSLTRNIPTTHHSVTGYKSWFSSTPSVLVHSRKNYKQSENISFCHSYEHTSQIPLTMYFDCDLNTTTQEVLEQGLPSHWSAIIDEFLLHDRAAWFKDYSICMYFVKEGKGYDYASPLKPCIGYYFSVEATLDKIYYGSFVSAISTVVHEAWHAYQETKEHNAYDKYLGEMEAYLYGYRLIMLAQKLYGNSHYINYGNYILAADKEMFLEKCSNSESLTEFVDYVYQNNKFSIFAYITVYQIIMDLQHEQGIQVNFGNEPPPMTEKRLADIDTVLAYLDIVHDVIKKQDTGPYDILKMVPSCAAAVEAHRL